MSSVFLGAIYVLLSLVAPGYVKKCPPTTLTAMTGEFSSPGYPDDQYPNAMRCRYIIRARPRHIVEITFDDFDMEPRNKDKRTDFVRIIDGNGKNPAQVVYYEGAMETPVTFVSKTRRAVVVFLANRRMRGKGFHATFRQISIEPEVKKYCDYPEVENAWGDCTEAGNEALYLSCNMSCVTGFELEGSMMAQCDTSDGTWTSLPHCVMIQSIVDICLRDITNRNCLYSAEDLAAYFSDSPTNATEEELSLIAEFGDDVADFGTIQDSEAVVRETEALVSITNQFEFDLLHGRGALKEGVPSISRSATTVVTCPSFMCLYDDEGNLKHTCPNIAQFLQSQNNLSNETTQNVMIQCFQCQNSGCSSIQLFD